MAIPTRAARRASSSAISSETLRARSQRPPCAALSTALSRRKSRSAVSRTPSIWKSAGSTGSVGFFDVRLRTLDCEAREARRAGRGRDLRRLAFEERQQAIQREVERGGLFRSLTVARRARAQKPRARRLVEGAARRRGHRRGRAPRSVALVVKRREVGRAARADRDEQFGRDDWRREK